MRITIFYSWQSDSPRAINRDFIEVAVQKAIDQITSDRDLHVDAAIDRDTEDTPGSPAIADTILHKISTCGIFLADVTMMKTKSVSRATPNPNVLIELGYALARIGSERIICVMNEEYGGPSGLPFDLRHKRWPIRYRLSQNATDEQREREQQTLSQNLELAIRTIVSSGILTPAINPKDRRVAIALYSAVLECGSVIYEFLRQQAAEEMIAIFQKNYSDKSETNYPSPDVVEPIMQLLAQTDLNTPSNMQVGNKTLTWLEALMHVAGTLSFKCNNLLDRYADRDDNLIAVAEDIEARARMLAFMIEVSLTRPEFRGFYEIGIPDQHVDWFRYFLLTILKVYRITREFGAE